MEGSPKLDLGEVISLLDALKRLLTEPDHVRDELPRRRRKVPDTAVDFYDAVRSFETRLIIQALRRTKGKQCEAARFLGLRPSTLNMIIKRHNISVATITYRADEGSG